MLCSAYTSTCYTLPEPDTCIAGALARQHPRRIDFAPSEAEFENPGMLQAAVLSRQICQIRHAIHGLVQSGKQAQAIGLECSIFGIHHHMLKERIHRSA